MRKVVRLRACNVCVCCCGEERTVETIGCAFEADGAAALRLHASHRHTARVWRLYRRLRLVDRLGYGVDVLPKVRA